MSEGPDDPAASGSDLSSLQDRPMTWPVRGSTEIYQGYAIELRRDTVETPDGTTFDRDVIAHRGVVAVIAVDDHDRVLVVNQYRHPAGQTMAEIPAGLLDVSGEDPLDAAKRELAEEGHIQASVWTPLLRLMLSPGISDETIMIYLAEGVGDSDVPEGFSAHDEEYWMTREWVPLVDVVDAVLDGRVKNAALVAGVLAVCETRRRAHR